MSHESPVLIVDDEPQVSAVIARHLKLAGLTSEPASCSEEALERISRADIALVIIDLNLGPHSEDSGTELLAKIRGLDPDLPLVICSGFPHMADDYPDVVLLPKPTTRDEFRNLVIVVKDKIRHRCRDVQLLETRQLGGETHTMMSEVHKLVTHPDRGLAATWKIAEEARKRGFREILDDLKKDPIMRALILLIGGCLAICANEFYAMRKVVTVLERKL